MVRGSIEKIFVGVGLFESALLSVLEHGDWIREWLIGFFSGEYHDLELTVVNVESLILLIELTFLGLVVEQQLIGVPFFPYSDIELIKLRLNLLLIKLTNIRQDTINWTILFQRTASPHPHVCHSFYNLYL